MSDHSAASIAGVVGPLAFIAAWMVGGVVAGVEYSPVDDAISRLAAVGADTRALMTAGFIVFGSSLPIFAVSLRSAVDGWAWLPAALTGLATLGVAATPLDRSDAVDQLHGVFAGFGYVTLVAVPLLAATPLWRLEQRRLAAAGVLAAAVSSASLIATLFADANGFFQRLGLTVTDLWIAALSLWLFARRPRHESSVANRAS